MKTKLIFVFVTLSLFIYSTCFSSQEYFKNDGANIEFRFLIDIDEKESGMDFVNQRGEIQRVNKEAIITSSDIAGISIQNNSITFYYKRNSWQKIRSATVFIKGKRLALINESIIICSPPLVGPIDRMSTLSSLNESDITAFPKSGFTFETSPSFIETEEVYIQFLKAWIIENPNDIDAIYSLAYHYVPENDFSNCKDAIPYLEKIFESSPLDDQTPLKLIQCYFKLENYNEVIKVSERWTANSSDYMKWAPYWAAGEAYYAMGDNNKAVENYQHSLEILRETKLPKPPDLKDHSVSFSLYDQQGWQDLEKGSKESKVNMISYLKERIELLKKEPESKKINQTGLSLGFHSRFSLAAGYL